MPILMKIFPFKGNWQFAHVEKCFWWWELERRLHRDEWLNNLLAWLWRPLSARASWNNTLELLFWGYIEKVQCNLKTKAQVCCNLKTKAQLCCFKKPLFQYTLLPYENRSEWTGILHQSQPRGFYLLTYEGMQCFPKYTGHRQLCKLQSEQVLKKGLM